MYCTQCGTLLENDTFFCSFCGKRKDTLLNSKPPISATEEEIITHYFNCNYQYDHILLFLKIHHGINISIRTLKRRLQMYNLTRRSSNITNEALKIIIEMEVNGPGALRGYRTMWNQLKCKYGIHVKRDLVSEILKEVDPDGSELRRARRLNRRRYISSGPNSCWHVDGYDKLKPYGLAIHGCVDGFSRRIMWLKVVRTNNNPIVPAYYFLETVKSLGYCPKLLRTDCGTENGIMADCQCFFYKMKMLINMERQPQTRELKIGGLILNDNFRHG